MEIYAPTGSLLSGNLHRIAFEWRKRDGYVENLNPSQNKELYAQDQLGLRMSVRWKPSDRVTVDLTGVVEMAVELNYMHGLRPSPVRESKNR